MTAVNKLIISQIKSLISKSNITVVCIDGPTAAGKTILAEKLGEDIKSQLKVNVEYFRLDWTLRSRKDRQKDLKILLKDEDDFLHEGEVHMDLNIFEKFLFKVDNLRNSSDKIKSNSVLRLEGLYSRENDGKCDGSYSYNFSNKTVIICEGHYTSRTEYCNFIDLNICLLCNKEELLKRKVERVKSYRSSKDAIDYFWKIDIPSFSYHISRYYQSVDYFIENSDYLNPKILSNSEAIKWSIFDAVKLDVISFKEYNLDFKKIYKKIFSASKLNQNISVDQFAEVINFYKFIDNVIRLRLQENLNVFEKGIKESLNSQINFLNQKLNDNQKTKIEVFSSSNSFLYDVYNRKIPANYGISVLSNDQKFNVNFTIHMYRCEILIFWAGGAFEICIERNLTTIKNKNTYKASFSNIINCAHKKEISNDIKLFTPTDYCIPEFIKGNKYNIIFTGREHEETLLIEILKKLLNESNAVLSHRLSINSEIEFYIGLLNSIGIPSLKVSNYIIGLNSKCPKMIENYKSWAKGWACREEFSSLDNSKYDLEVIKELEEAEKKVLSFSKTFHFIDSFLFSKESKDHDLVIKELSHMLNSSNRSLRKRAFQYISKEEPSLEIDVQKLFECYGIEEDSCKNSKFELTDLPRIYPSIMAEIYLWQHLRGDKSAILGANVYDISEKNSLDINALLEASLNKNTAIIFQSSFNAIGQKEELKNKNFEGYLKIDNGPKKLVDSCLESVIKSIFIKKSSIPFYGIGLDHVDARNDMPSGRALRFLDLALSTGNITHVVLDGSYLFKAKDRSLKSLSNAYEKVARYEVEMIEQKKDLFLIDLEYCVGEMNYIGDSELSMIPEPSEIILFINILRKKLRDTSNGQFNCRPSLFIGNVGTTHHSKDLSLNIDSSISNSWVESVKNKNFVSAVLHGTTNTEINILSESTNGCHKVNVAGDFLKVYQNSLPNNCSKELKIFGPKSKYLMPEISKIKSNFSESDKLKIENNLKKRSSEIIKALNSPILSERDKSYFHRSSYKFPPELIEHILDKYKQSKYNKSLKNFSKINNNQLFFSASMIEVPFENGFCEIADELIKNGMRHFHIDVGDGKFISRKFSGLNKLSYLSNLNMNLKLHTHLMVENPMILNSNQKSYIDDYIEAGSTSIAVHLRSFKNQTNLKKAIEYIKKRNCRPGILIEVTDTNLNHLWETIRNLEISWVIIMGVPIGYGGQLFQSRCLRTINFLRSKSLENNYLNFDIEIDGGLNFSNINECLRAGANIFAGWSIIKNDSKELIIDNYKKILSQFRRE